MVVSVKETDSILHYLCFEDDAQVCPYQVRVMFYTVVKTVLYGQYNGAIYIINTGRSLKAMPLNKFTKRVKYVMIEYNWDLDTMMDWSML